MNAEMKFTAKGFDLAHTEKCDKENICVHGVSMDEMREMGVISEDCHCSLFTMISVASGILMAVGTVVYSLLVI